MVKIQEMDKRYTVNEVREIINKWLSDTSRKDYKWIDKNVLTDEEFNYSIMNYGGGIYFESIIVSFSDEDNIHAYKEFSESDYDSIYDLIDDAFSNETYDYLDNKYTINMRKKLQNRGI